MKYTAGEFAFHNYLFYNDEVWNLYFWTGHFYESCRSQLFIDLGIDFPIATKSTEIVQSLSTHVDKDDESLLTEKRKARHMQINQTRFCENKQIAHNK